MNDAEQVIADIEQMGANSDEAKDQIGKTVRYLGERKDMVNYGALKRGSYPPSCIKKMAYNWETRMNIESKPH